MSYMKVEFDEVLKKYGHNIYLQRRIQDDDSGAAYSPKFEIHTVRYMVTGQLSDITQQQMYGVTNTSDRTYYFRKEAKPFEGDRIYEYDPSVDQTVWEIDAVTMMRGLGGDVEFYTCGATRKIPN